MTRPDQAAFVRDQHRLDPTGQPSFLVVSDPVALASLLPMGRYLDT